MDELIALMADAIASKTFIRCIISNPRKQNPISKIVMRPILLKDVYQLQLTKTQGNKALHENLEVTDLSSWLLEIGSQYKQIQLFTSEADYQCLLNKKGKLYMKKLAPTLEQPTTYTHNRQKNYILDSASSHGFLKALGLMDASGHITPSKYDKYKQINRYLEFVADCMPTLGEGTIRIIDFGCGKSYLTFALYHYLTEILNKKVEVVGLDLKEDVIAFCNDLATTLNYKHLHFQVGDIGHYTTDQPIDMVVSLHACNTATDAALEKAIMWDAKVILAVPCCHHEAYTQIQNDTLTPLLKHGILKERIAALVTDGLRAQLLESCGYEVQVMEFIDMAHTPKNILIKALRSERSMPSQKAYEDYQEAAKTLHLQLSLEKALLDKKRLIQTES